MIYFSYSLLAILVAFTIVSVSAQDGPDGPPVDPNAPSVTSVAFLIPDGTEKYWQSPVVVTLTVREGDDTSHQQQHIISGDSDYPTTMETARVICAALQHPLPDYETNISNVISYDYIPRDIPRESSNLSPGPRVVCSPEDTPITNCTCNLQDRPPEKVVYFNCGPKPTPNVTFELTMYLALYDTSRINAERLQMLIPRNIAEKYDNSFDSSRISLRVTTITDVPPATETVPIYVANINITDGPPPSKEEIQTRLAEDPYSVLPSRYNVTLVKINGQEVPSRPYIDRVELDGEDSAMGRGIIMLHLSNEEDHQKGALCAGNSQQNIALFVLCRKLGHNVPSMYIGYDLVEATQPPQFVDLKCDGKDSPLRYCTYQPITDGVCEQQVFLDCYKNKPEVVPEVKWTTQLNKTYYGNDFTTAQQNFSTQMSKLFNNFNSIMNIRHNPDDDIDNGMSIVFSASEDDRANKITDVKRLYRALQIWADSQLFSDAYSLLRPLHYEPRRLDFNDKTFRTKLGDYSLKAGNIDRGVLYVVSPTDGSQATISIEANEDIYRDTALMTCRGVSPIAGLLIGVPGGVGQHITATYSCANYRCSVSGDMNNKDTNHNNDVGVICSDSVNALPEEESDTWVANIQLKVTGGFSWDKFVESAVKRFAALTNRLELLSNTADTYTFFVKDNKISNAPRIDGEYFFLNSKFDNVNEISYTYGPPAWPADRFVPTNTEGWKWSRDKTSGLITVTPKSATDAGYICYENFPQIAAAAICKATGTDVSAADPSVYMYVQDTPVPSNKMYISNIRCLSDDIKNCSMEVDISGQTSCGDSPTKNAVYLQCGTTKEDADANFKGFVNFTVTMKTSEKDSYLASGLKTLVGVEPIITELATSGDYGFYNVAFPRDSDVNNMISANNKLVKEDPAKLYELARIYEIRNDRDSDYRSPPMDTSTGSWILTLFTESDNSLTGGAKIGRLSVYWKNTSYTSLTGTLCGLGMNMNSFTSAANSLCSSQGLRNLPSPGRILRNYGTGQGIVYFSNLQNGLQLPQQYSSFFSKDNDCTFMDSVGLLCGEQLRAPPAAPVEYTLTLSDASKQSSLQSCIAGLMDLQLSDVNVDGTKVTFSNDNWAVYFMYLNEYQLKTKCGVTSKEITVPYAPLTTTPRPTKKQPITPAPTSSPTPIPVPVPGTTNASNTTEDDSSSSSSNIGVIIAVVVVVIIVLAGAGVGVVFYIRRKRAAEEGYDDLTTPMGDMNAAAVVTPTDAA